MKRGGAGDQAVEKWIKTEKWYIPVKNWKESPLCARNYMLNLCVMPRSISPMITTRSFTWYNYCGSAVILLHYAECWCIITKPAKLLGRTHCKISEASFVHTHNIVLHVWLMGKSYLCYNSYIAYDTVAPVLVEIITQLIATINIYVHNGNHSASRPSVWNK